MAIFTWSDSIALGIPSIDRQHQALFDWINSLSSAVVQGEGRDKVAETIINLVNYVDVHFRDEEQLMVSCSYPALAEHRREHDQFVSHVHDIQISYSEGRDIGESVLNFLVEWMIFHIKGTDQGYNRFIKQKEGES